MADAGDLQPNCVIQDRETEKSECGFYLLESGSRGGLPEMSSGPVETEAQEGTLLVNIGVFPFTSSSGSGLVVGVLDEGRRFKENFESFIESLDRDRGGFEPSTTTASTVSSPSVSFS